ncbi:bifunctional fucokinase/fucose-1-phosphate guanylyltransferase [Prevotella sp. tf2-5]|uniref:bifunctional fucokinase/fucose-1-phosphate guanylyltransferase n=1 Tax=Prevotella sp. tf2-5 TaxID=1761889 RepID=UPI0008F04A1A|nr:bifunctional fucokinase/fucose-1-phosphate guanylyltransferase [Prevotella sp. tf2-5]SFO41903.1 Predicted kinase [Prevotella sp. tf2-5]
MKKLLSVPPNVVDCFHELTGLSREEYFCTCDPIGHRLGSGGGTTWLLQQAADWLGGERSIILHAGGQSKRLPSYAVSGKILAPIPVFRWERGQRLSQTLLDLQLPLYERMMEAAPKRLRTMIVSGDVYIRAAERIGAIPDADVVCYGLWLDASIAKDHGVFVSDRRTPNVLKMMLQKPSTERLSALLKDHFYLTDIGIWLLSDRALELLRKRSENSEYSENSTFPLKEYDLYSEFGCALGTQPTIDDPELGALSVAIVPLPGGEFYHFGTSREMISSTLAIQNIVNDQREIMHHDRKPHPSIFTQNAVTHYQFTPENQNIWIENSFIGPRWRLTRDHVITGVPENDWEISLEPGECMDVVPVGEDDYEVRRYHIDDAVNSNEVAQRANLRRLFAQRNTFRQENWRAMARNWQHSVFYQLDLDDAAREFEKMKIELPPVLPDDAPLMTRIHDAMFRQESTHAFSLLREGLTADVVAQKQQPQMSVYQDQIVWGRSPVRIDLAGGWTDTPPYCLMEGGSVVNIAIELNGQPPLQAYVRPSKEYRIVLRSIDLGASEVVETYEQLGDFMHVGSPFSIPKAALALAGFLPRFSAEVFPSLKAQLEAFGGGIELTLLSAVPAGSGLGTSSILAATVLGAVSDFCSLAWDKNEIGRRTLVLEQLLTTGGGWQDQFGGVLGGVKLLETTRGFEQNPVVRWLPDDVFTQPEYQSCHLLYYTGVTRTAKKILAEIVRRMFLNQHEQLLMLRAMKAHALDMYEAIQRNDFAEMGRLVRKTWQQNQLIDSGTNPDAVRRITDLIDDLCLGYKLPGAGGGGYLYMVAKDPEAAARVKQIIQQSEQNPNARFVDMTLSKKGLQISRS